MFKLVPKSETESPIPKLLFGFLALLLVVAIATIISNMPGPDFLLFYGAVVTITLLVSGWQVQDTTKNQALPLIPAEPDPYEIAYLRSGEMGVAKVAVMDLSQRGYLQISEESIKQAENHPDLSVLTTIQREAFDWFATPTASRTSGWLLARKLQPHCTVYQQHLQNEQLLTPDKIKARTKLISWIGASIIVGLGGFKLVVASLHSRDNIGYLVVMGGLSFSFLQNFCQIPRLSTLGGEYLKQLEATFAQLKQKIQADIPEETFAQLKQKVEIGIPSEFEYNLAIALYGFEVLAGTRYDRYHNIFSPVLNTASSQNSSSGGGGGGCGSSCSSSDGGGGCSGCGGCGGGGD